MAASKQAPRPRGPLPPGVVPTKGGGTYMMVMPRLYAAMASAEHPDQPAEPHHGVSAVKSEPYQLGMRTVIVATVEFDDGFVSQGVAEAMFHATEGADFTNPIESAQTSAIGRALAFAGWPGSENGIAGAEEMAIARAVATSAHKLARTAHEVTITEDVDELVAPPPHQQPRPTQTKDGKSKMPPAEYYVHLISIADEWNQQGGNVITVAFDDPPPKAPESWFMEHGPILKQRLIAAGLTKSDLRP